MLQPLSPTYLTNPYETFERLRNEQPVFFDKELNMWIVTRYNEIQAVFKDSKTFSSSLNVSPIFSLCPHAGQVLSRLPGGNIVSLDPPNHTRVRKAISSVFPMTVHKALVYEPMIRTLVKQLLDRMDGKNELDLVTEFTWELPVLVILELLGVPEEDVKQVKEWADGWLALAWGHAPEEEQVRAAYSMVHFYEYCRKLVDQRVEKPKDDLVSKLLVYRQDNDEVLTLNEIATLIFSLLIAGHETTSNLISNGVFQLLTKESAWEQLVNHPEKIPGAVEEILRYDSPVICWQRFTAKDGTIGGISIPKGQRILLLVGSANRDESHFTDAEEFQTEREDAHEHLSFGKGRHFCLGASLARLEAKIAFEELTQHFPNLRLAESFQASFVPNVAFRILQSLPVVLK
jgi:cytochrome P450